MGKLVRDMIPAIIEADTGKAPHIRRLIGAEAVSEFKKKILEESTELNAAESRQEVRAELADISEAFDGLLRELRISHEELEHIKQKKREVRGGFVFMYYLEQ